MKKIPVCALLIISAILCVQNVYAQNVYYVATGGDDSNPGTFYEPFATLQRAIDVSRPGDTTYIRGGIYYITSPQSIDPTRKNSTAASGTAENPIHYFNYPGENPIFDGSAMETLVPSGIYINRVQYIKFKGITVRNVFQNTIHRDPAEIARGWTSTGSANLTFERCTAHDIHGRGWQHWGGAWNEWDKPENAPFECDNTTWINCDAYDLYDPLSAAPGNNADGWVVFSYQYNVLTWIGCRAWKYADDGVDVFGAGYRYFYNSWMMSTDKYAYLSHADGSGFKNWAPYESEFFPELLEDTVLVRYVNSMAVFNTSNGIGNNNMWQERHNTRPNNALFLNNLTFGNGIGIFCWSRGDWNPSVFRNNISWGSKLAAHGYDPYLEVGIYRVLYDHANSNTWLPTGGWPGWVYNENFTLEDAAFTSLDSLTIVNEITAPRKTDGSLPDITWARLVADSDMKGAGINVGMSKNPDIGVDWAWLDAGGGVATAPPASESMLSRSSPAFTFSTNRDAIVIEPGQSRRGRVEVALYDGRGRRVSLLHGAGGESLRIETKAFAPGVYTIQIRTDGQSHTRRFVVSRQGRAGR